MGVKSEKTFEEIVERLVALFKPASPEVTSPSAPAREQADEPHVRRPHPIPDTSSDSDDNTR